MINVLLDNLDFVFINEMKQKGSCLVCIFEYVKNSEKWYIVLVTEVNSNLGPSVTNAAESIADQICELYKINPEQTMFIERYEDRPHELDMVDFNLIDGKHKNPKWKRITTQFKQYQEFTAVLDRHDLELCLSR